MAKKNQLSNQEQVFITEYLKSDNASAAYRIAFPLSQRWKDKSVHERASRLLAAAKVQSRIAELRRKVSESQEITVSKVVSEIDRIGRVDPFAHIYGENGELTDPRSWPEDVRRSVASIETLEEYSGTGKNRVLIGFVRKVKFWPKTAALDMLMKHTGGYELDNEQKNPFANLTRDQLRLLESILSELESEAGTVGKDPTTSAGSAPGVTH